MQCLILAEGITQNAVFTHQWLRLKWKGSMWQRDRVIAFTKFQFIKHPYQLMHLLLILQESQLHFILCYKRCLLFISKAVSYVTIRVAYGLLISFKCRECLSHRKLLTDVRKTVPDQSVSKLNQKDIKSIRQVWELNSNRSSKEKKKFPWGWVRLNQCACCKSPRVNKEGLCPVIDLLSTQKNIATCRKVLQERILIYLKCPGLIIILEKGEYSWGQLGKVAVPQLNKNNTPGCKTKNIKA